MKKLLTIVFVFSFLAVNAQQKQKETKEERQERYIQEGNPFKEFGYQPKIATLSKGKYREFFTDTIVQIGSFTYNRMSKQITGILTIENKGFSEADLRPDLVSRWMSPDPLSDEFPDVSPYNFVNNNPIRFIDPLGLAPEDVIIKGNRADEAFEQLQASTSLTLTRDEKTGKVTATGEATTDADKTLLSATTDDNITVTLNATNKTIIKTSSGKNSLQGNPGAFEGSTVNADGTIDASQTVNPEVASITDEVSGQAPGTVVQHEVIEAYVGAQQSPGAGDSNDSRGAYQTAHNTTLDIQRRSGVAINPAGAIVRPIGRAKSEKKQGYQIINRAGTSRVLYKKGKQ